MVASVHICCSCEVEQNLAFEDVQTSSAEVEHTTKCNEIPLSETNHLDFINLCMNERSGLSIHMSQECKLKPKTCTRPRECVE
jgi:hypothetical protein